MKQISRTLLSSNFSIFPVVDRRDQMLRVGDADQVNAVPVFINTDRITKTLGMMAVLLVLSSIAIQLTDQATGYSSVVIHKMVKLLNVDLELNIPTFFSTLILLFASLLLAAIAFLKDKQKASYVLHWGVLSTGFLFMAFDEAFSVHERLIEPMRAILGEENLGILYFAWVVPAFVLILALSLAYLKFGMSLPANIRCWFIVAGALYVGAAVGFELIEGIHVEIYGKENLLYIALATVEEALEMAGVIVFIRTLLVYLADISGKLEFRFGQFSKETK